MPNQTATSQLEAACRPSKLRVLVTDDNFAMRRLMAETLEYEGYRVTEAANAFEMQSIILLSSLKEGSRSPFDLIVSDVFMPGKNGLEALSELRQTGLQSRFLVITSFPDANTYNQIEALDLRLLVKPFSLKEFRTAAAAMLQMPVANSESER
jgi:CheY-like chemotaxis protein